MKPSKSTLTLQQQVADFITAHPGCNIRDLVVHFKRERKAIVGTVTRLRGNFRIKNGKLKKDGLVTYFPDQSEREDDPAYEPKQVRSVSWPPLKIKPQHIWSAVMD